MVSAKPYLIRAIYEWCVDQGFTPYLDVQVDDRTRVPSGYARDGRIVLNVAPDATHQLTMDNEQVAFQARFNGVAHHILVPIDNVTAIYARENGQGMAFELLHSTPSRPGDPPDAPPPPDGPPSPGGLSPRASHLKVIK